VNKWSVYYGRIANKNLHTPQLLLLIKQSIKNNREGTLKWIKFSPFFLILLLIITCITCSTKHKNGILKPDLDSFRAYYTRINSGEEFEKYARVGDYADIVVDLGTKNGKLVFWRGSSYLPYWQTANGRWFVREIVPRKGDGNDQMPDKVNTYSHVKIIENTPEKVVVHWRYLPKFSGKNPHNDVSAIKFVDEYFTITPTGEVTRIIRIGTKKIDDWRDPLNRTTQKFLLTLNGVEEIELIKPRHSTKKAAPVKGAAINTEFVDKPIAGWKFDEGQGDITVESVSGIACSIEGHKSLWRKGVSGAALQFDGYTSVIIFPGSKAPKVSSAITLEGWIALGAYPWSWAPIIQQCDDVPEEIERIIEEGEVENPEEADFKMILKKENDTGYFLGIDGHGYPCFKLKVGDSWEELTSNVHLERRQWYHIAGTFDKDEGKMTIYVNCQPAGEKTVAHKNILMSLKDIKIGQGKPRRPVDPVRMNTFVNTFSIDGLLDEIYIYDKALSANQIKQSFEKFKPSLADLKNPEMDKRVLPEDESRGKFGAYYTLLKYYDVWDNLWRFSEHADVVVEFDELPIKFIFWHGAGYVPMIVNEKGQWYSNEFNETWNKSGGKGCQEPMSDKGAYSNHVRIIENSAARVVIHWRYPLKDVLQTHANYVEETGWSDWADWYYFIYPDGVAVKLMHLWTSGERNHEFIEGMAIYGPDQHPETIIETKPALYLADNSGNVVAYDWVPGRNIHYTNMKIIMINYRAKYKPFTIGDFTEGSVYKGELTKYSAFPAWNHWPVAQILSDGRYASFPDRAGHSSLIDNLVWPIHEEAYGDTPEYNWRHIKGKDTISKPGSGDRPYYSKILMEGMTDKPAGELASLAKSWLNPAKLTAISGCVSDGYDKAQRAYMVKAEGNKITFEIEGNSNSPIVNPCFVISNWKEKETKVTVVGQHPDDVKIGYPSTVKDKDIVVWLRMECENKVKIIIESAE
jgi:hypothetical protein